MIHTFKKSHGGREHLTSVRFKKDLTNDCSIRAITHFIYGESPSGYEYEDIRNHLFKEAKNQCSMPNSDKVLESFLKSRGFTKQSPLTHNGKRKYAVGKFPLSGKHLVRTCKQLTCIIDGVVVDTWDCRKSKAQSYYVFGGE